ncbi:hypothetical protein COW94_04715 [Candidatus Peregrinibacteria bacterium CG22_combo_CG10-13_8_21_14_all_44_10]|nr:MAG: hypothetical protein AUK45_03085 [Candidatus Peregrinibacteria bacterium CG2_30_44_17]PIP65878.1 MAG: hypothetical protein COW94_04715 [Candidatus Peregrinibacteria bacterium CG22_combo_CG10-13_8_21_14_all_44_10]PIS04516.1 MAG: hypothetical protein COT83_00140 [Candidatus Peregrinibacteria bacterium CG10_big_fil_rev_8_21_14_0_10_44_7]PIX80200.1 MAG: hypothetical protein COZ35_01470 [Candidatus Peregrinibacteria bacterium CG_4_10_14_3_um_filter_44_21]
MEIGVNARFLEKRVAGIGQYTGSLFRKLAEINPNDNFTLVVRQKIDHDFPQNVCVKIIPEKKWLLFGGPKKGFWEHCQLRRFFNSQKFDVVHFTYPAYPIRGLAVPSVTTIHDIIPWQDKRYRKKIRSKIYFWLTGKALKKAPQFIAVSETTKHDFAKQFSINPSKITVTYEAVSDSYKNPTTECKLPTTNYLLYVGGYDARKNVKKLVSLVSQLKEPNLTLILAGGKLDSGKLYDSYNLQKSSQESSVNVLKTGFLNEEELSALYKNAKALINISEKEGFNLPLLEAAYVGTPVITSDIPVHRELYGDYAVFLPLNDDKKSLKILRQFMKNPQTPKVDLKEKYNWENSAKITYNAYLKTIKRCSGLREYISSQ